MLYRLHDKIGAVYSFIGNILKNNVNSVSALLTNHIG